MKKRSKRIDLLVYPEEKQLLEEAATHSNVSISHFIRHFSLLQAKFLLDAETTQTKLGGNQL